MKNLTKDPINQKNPNTYMFTKHIQTYIHNEKEFKQTKEKSKKLILKKIELEDSCFLSLTCTKARVKNNTKTKKVER
jgi:tmRNA-binding protein